MTVLLDVDQLRAFVAIAETGSFTKAAEVVNKTQSAVSMQMKRLEERLERPIFARDGRASKLTEDGQRLLDYARRIVKLNVETLAAFSDAELSGRVRLGVPDDQGWILTGCVSFGYPTGTWGVAPRQPADDGAAVVENDLREIGVQDHLHVLRSLQLVRIASSKIRRTAEAFESMS